MLLILKDNNKLPPKNTNYKPNCIDLSTVLKRKDEKNKRFNIYWTIPPLSFGEISYKIVNDWTKEEEVILSLPYSIPLSSSPITFKVITISNVEENVYESNPSEPITM